MTLGPAAFALIGFIGSIALVTGVFGVTRALETQRDRARRYPSLG